MTRFDQSWCDQLAGAVGGLGTESPVRILYVVTETDEGKVAFHLQIDNESTEATAGKLPRGEKADVTVTAKEAVLAAIWSGDRNRDEAFMAGDIKVEGAYNQWLDVLVPLFAAPDWSKAWASQT